MLFAAHFYDPELIRQTFFLKKTTLLLFSEHVGAEEALIGEPKKCEL